VIFQTVVADPAWAPRDKLPGPKRGAAKHYNTMPTADIRALAYRLPPLAPDALLFLWRLSSMPFDGLDVCKAWGFEPVSEIVWVKTPRAGALSRGRLLEMVHGMRARKVRILLGHYVRMSHEVCIIAARPGAAARIQRHNIPSVLFAPLGAHSAKPAAFYRLVEALAPGPYLELFARTSRGPQWTAIGDALGSKLDLPLAPSRSA
jgi:N6-adenosine-specific RNA methylase IME4